MIKSLKDQNTYLNSYILELSQEIETITRRYDDAKISLETTK